MYIDELTKQIENNELIPASLNELEDLWGNYELSKLKYETQESYHLFYVDYENEFINMSRSDTINIYVEILMENLIDISYMKSYSIEDLTDCILNWTEQEEGYYYKLYITKNNKLVPIILEEFGVEEIVNIIYNKINV